MGGKWRERRQVVGLRVIDGGTTVFAASAGDAGPMLELRLRSELVGRVAPEGTGGGISNLGGDGALVLVEEVRCAIDIRFVEATRLDMGREMGDGARAGPANEVLSAERGVAVGWAMKCEGEGGQLGRGGRTARGSVKTGRTPPRGGM